MNKPFGLWKRRGIYYWHTPQQPDWRTTGKKSKKEAMEFVLIRLEEMKAKKAEEGLISLHDYIEPFFTWDRCPHIRRLLDENKSITKRYAITRRYLVEKHILKDSLANKPLSKIKRTEILDFRSCLL